MRYEWQTLFEPNEKITPNQYARNMSNALLVPTAHCFNDLKVAE